MDVNTLAVEKLFNEFNNPPIMIHGHTHRPKIHNYKFNGVKSKRVVLNDWYESGSFLLWDKGKLKNIKGFKIRLKGDGKKYKFRLRESYRSSNYSTDFDTKSGIWTSIEILVSDLNPMFMGYYSRNTKKLEIENISSLGFQISDKQEGEFKLEIMHVKALY